MANNDPVEDLGLPKWAWPVIGMISGTVLIFVVQAACFAKNSR